MFNHSPAKIAAPIISAIEDAVLFGHVRELVGVLELVKDEDDFPINLLYALESLLYFRMHYGKGGDLEGKTDSDRQKYAQMESSWSREVISSLGHAPDLIETKYA